MNSPTGSAVSCQVDFYLLKGSLLEAGRVACRLALMAWERRQKIFIVAASKAHSEALDELLWQYPEGRFLPHTGHRDPNASMSPVIIGTLGGLNPTDVVINLCDQVVPKPEQFERVLEIVPYAVNERNVSRMKYKTYRDLGFSPHTHEISR